ncbi:hypothetical protein HRI_005139000 [Hibiscus trionum]|uniref:Uncharacterized protein n=1 Tax=Hibiscus trionum TaxID=183268 RepID=A0A9W7JKJ4_HIBTR|nr:hypothetical protein HRI_005139000 [Hibiscus trionum]
MGGLIDLNTTEDDETPSSGSLSPSSSSASGLSSASGPGSSVCFGKFSFLVFCVYICDKYFKGETKIG